MKLENITHIIITALIINSAKAANDPIEGPVRVSSVEFADGLKVRNDDGSDMPTPHWKDEHNNAKPTDEFPDGIADKDDKPAPNQFKSYAYSYHAEQTPKLQATFKWKNGAPPEGRSYWAKGVVIDSENSTFVLPLQELEGGTLYKFRAANKKVVDERRIQAYLTGNRKVARKGIDGIDRSEKLKPLKIRWTVYDKSKTKVVGESYSTHTIYVTWDTAAQGIRETVFNLSCVMANDEVASTTTKKDAVAVKIYSEFQDLEIKRMDGVVLGYYRGETSLTTANEILNSASANGQCGCFADLLYKVLAVNAVGATPCNIKPLFAGIEPRILVKNWTFNNVGTLPGPWTHRVDWDDPAESEISPQPEGVKGQGPAIPIFKKFQQHYVVFRSGRIYDPSYGTVTSKIPASSPELDWESASLDGYTRKDITLVSDNPLAYERDVTAARVEEPDNIETEFTPFHL